MQDTDADAIETQLRLSAGYTSDFMTRLGIACIFAQKFKLDRLAIVLRYFFVRNQIRVAGLVRSRFLSDASDLSVALEASCVSGVRNYPHVVLSLNSAFLFIHAQPAQLNSEYLKTY